MSLRSRIVMIEESEVRDGGRCGLALKSFSPTRGRMAEPPPNTRTVSVALKLLMTQRRAARAYYQRNTDAMKARSAAYWSSHREEINQRRRERYAVSHPKKHPAPDSETKPLPLL